MRQTLYSRRRIAESISVTDVVPAIKRVFVEKFHNRVQMPAKNYLYFEENNGDLRTMPAHVSDLDLATVKVVNAHPGNPTNHDLPTVMALVLAIDPETGFPKAVLDGTEITALRTAAASALSTRVLAPDESTSLGILGTGDQARYQLRGQLHEKPFEKIHLYDVKPENARRLGEWIEENYPEAEITIHSEPAALYEHCDVIVSLTPVTTPVIDPLPNRADPILINAMGADAPEKQEWPRELLETAGIVVDDWDQASHSGEISGLVETGGFSETDIWATLGEVLDSPPENRPDQIVFDSTGLAIQDTAVAWTVLESDIQPDGEFDFLS